MKGIDRICNYLIFGEILSDFLYPIEWGRSPFKEDKSLNKGNNEIKQLQGINIGYTKCTNLLVEEIFLLTKFEHIEASRR